MEAADAVACLGLEPLPFNRDCNPNDDFVHDPFFHTVLEMLINIDEPAAEQSKSSSQWPQLPLIKIPFEPFSHAAQSDEVLMTPDDQRALPSLRQVMSPSGGADPSRKRLHVEAIPFGMMDGDEESQQQKRMLTNSRRDEVTKLRDEARALETTLKSLQLRKSRPKAALSDDPDALIKSYSENIQLKRAIEEQDVRIKTLRRAVSLRQGSNLIPQPLEG